MSASGDGPQNNQNGQQVNQQRFANGDQQPANEPVNGGFVSNLYLALRDIRWFLHELIASVLEQYDDLYGSDDDDNDNNVNAQNINVRDNNANADNNEQHQDRNAVVGGIENEAFEDRVDVHQYIPEEDPQPGVSRRRSRELDEEDVEPNKRIRWSDDDSDFFSASDTDSEGCPHAGNIADEDISQQVREEEPQPGGSTKRSREEDVDEEERNSKKSRLANSDSGTSSTVYDHSESSSDGLFEDAHEELDNHEAGGSRKRSREDFEEEEEYLPVCKLRRCSNESSSSSDED
ncbi:protein starmaker-like isoform X1 [Simochromis diagramma]|uniref:protein starmaker-like isoform X1 n=1 Tax=Simochromis diagramma TaxID=43689 RepID=UPI001A7EF1D1|nr:protein starmaker-like isoform X1 [Simochromis diagramma]XP_039862229.1 protein starmaker-like isoform X1 [Simochromis diagramma]XP_039862232.1 protein starmaker-like isoform X1 [Simochromis diagramma]